MYYEYVIEYGVIVYIMKDVWEWEIKDIIMESIELLRN